MTGDKLKSALWEADRHSKALISAFLDWDNDQKPLSIEEIENNPLLMRLTDQILFRFTKLQDAIGQRLIPATLAMMQEPYEEWAMLDRLNRLEKLGFIDVDCWLGWREIRNRLAHEYPEHDDMRLSNLYQAINAAREIITAYQNWCTRLEPYT